MSNYVAIVKDPNQMRQYNELREAAIDAGKTPVDICCDKTKEVFDRLFARFDVDEKIVEIFKQGFNTHLLTDIQKYLDHKDLKIIQDIRISEYADEIFDWANMLNGELRDFFLDQFLFEVERQNVHQNLWITRDKIMNEIKARRERETMPQQGKQFPRLSLSNRYGAKVDFLRVMNALFELHFFNDEAENPLTKENFMQRVGMFFNTDLSGFSDNLNQAYNNTKLETNLRIFDEMKEFTQKRCIGSIDKT